MEDDGVGMTLEGLGLVGESRGMSSKGSTWNGGERVGGYGFRGEGKFVHTYFLDCTDLTPVTYLDDS